MDKYMQKNPTKKAQPVISERQFDDNFRVTDEIKDAFKTDGMFMLRNLFDKEEVQRLLEALDGNPVLEKAWELNDGEGAGCRLLVWKHPGNDITGMVSRCEKVVTTAEELLGGSEVYHYHSKLMMKDARVGGKFHWHQDYGYWYQNGILKPDLLTVFIPLDKCTQENGCLQVIRGSQRCGRIQHDSVNGQVIADPKRVHWIEEQEEFPLVHAEMNPGDALFFHCNVLHRSEKNKSDKRRWAFLVAYNRADNDPMFDHHCPRYTPLHKVKNEAVKMCTNFTDFTGKEIMDPLGDATVSLKEKNDNSS